MKKKYKQRLKVNENGDTKSAAMGSYGKLKQVRLTLLILQDYIQAQ